MCNSGNNILRGFSHVCARRGKWRGAKRMISRGMVALPGEQGGAGVGGVSVLVYEIV